MTRTQRKPYTKSKRFDKTCRNHGSCSYCKNTRTHTENVRARISAEKFNDWWDQSLDKLDEIADNSDTPS